VYESHAALGGIVGAARTVITDSILIADPDAQRSIFSSRTVCNGMIPTGYSHPARHDPFHRLTVLDDRLEFTIVQDPLAHIIKSLGIDVALTGFAVDRMAFLIQLDIKIRPSIPRDQTFLFARGRILPALPFANMCRPCNSKPRG
jgi:hypothetical protein